MNVLYICNRQKCSNCSDECNHTTDVRFAKNFTLEEKWNPSGEYFMYAVEKDNASNSACLIGGENNV